MRNPWKFSFDALTGETIKLIIADVGQNAWEEVDFEPRDGAGEIMAGETARDGHVNLGIKLKPFPHRPCFR